MTETRRFPAAVRAAAGALERAGDPDKARAMAGYMYSQQYERIHGVRTGPPFLGVPKPARVPITKDLVAAVDPTTSQEYRHLVLDLWQLPHREEKYLALDVAQRLRRFRTADAMDLYERLILEGAWWDLVDTVVTRLVNPVLLEDPTVWGRVDGWITAEDLWLRRSAIISQLKSKHRTDRDRLARYCTARMHEREFFIRKAIGWALREYAKTDPDWVRSFTDAHRGALSGLSHREATKHL